MTIIWSSDWCWSW